MDQHKSAFIRINQRFNKSALISGIKYFLLATALAPLAFLQSVLYPFITTKVFFVKGLVEVAMALALVFLLWTIIVEKVHFRELVLHYRDKIKSAPRWMTFFALLFVLSKLASTVLADFPYRAFWGGLERGEGLFSFLHFAIFFFLLTIFFEKKDFLAYFRISVVVGLVIYWYAFLQALRITDFPFSLPLDARAGSFMGNGAFLAAYSFFVMIAGVITLMLADRKADARGLTVANNKHTKKLWACLSCVAIVATPFVIFITKTRGAMIGLGATIVVLLVYFVFKKPPIQADGKLIGADNGNKISANQSKSALISVSNKEIRINQRYIAVTALVVLVVFGATLFLTRDAAIWQKVPGLDRLTRTTLLSTSDGSTQTRLLGWQLSTNAFIKKPIFGWGVEHYLRAFQELYNPEFGTYGEVWLDRAHNAVLDVAVAQGAFGLAGYLGFLAVIFYFFFKKGENRVLRFSVGAVFVGYFLQNLFLLEELHSTTPFFALMAAIAVGLFSGDKESENVSMWGGSTSLGRLNLQKLIPFVGASILVFAATFFLLYNTIVVPFAQAYYTHKVETPKSKEDFLNLFEKATGKYNFAQYSIRSHLLDFFFANQGAVFTSPALSDVAAKFTDGLREILEKEPFDIRTNIRINQAYLEMAKYDPSFYPKAEEIAKEGLEISPLRQELVYGAGIAMAGQGKNDEAVALFEESIAANPRVAPLYFNYGIALAAVGRNEAAIKAFAMVRKLDPFFDRSINAGNAKALISIYESLGDAKDAVLLITDSARGLLHKKFDLIHYEKALLYYLDREDKEGIVVVGEFIAKNFSERRGDMETIVDLAKRGEWEILKSL